MNKFFAIVLLLFQWKLCGYELCVVTMFRNEAPYLKEWVEYHLLAGVDHFWMYNNHSDDDWKEVLEPYISQGIIEVITWPQGENAGSFIIKQLSAFSDGIKRAQGVAKWVALIDIDEFIVPMAEKDIPTCLNTHFYFASEVYVNWRMFGTNHVTIPIGSPIMTSLTACSSPSFEENCVGKSIVRPEHVRVDNIWYPHHFPLVNGAGVYDSRRRQLYFNERDDLVKENGYFDHYLRINHYYTRDESYYKKYRLPKSEKGNWEMPLWKLQHFYRSLNVMQDRTILNYIWNYHRDKYIEFWLPFDRS